MSARATRPVDLLQRTRRRLLTGSVAFAAPAIAGCDVPFQQPRGASPITTYAEVLAPPSIGRPRRADAWNRRFGEDTRVLLTVVSPASRPLGAADRAGALASLEATGRGPAIVWLPFQSLPDVAARTELRPIDVLVKRDRVDLKAFMPCALQPAYGLDQRLYGLPEQVDAGQVYFNRQHLLDAGIDFRRAGLDFERPSSHWEGLRRVALDLLLGRQTSDRTPWFPGGDGAPLEVWGWANGGEWIDAAGRRAAFTRDENVEALDWLVAHSRELGGAERSQPLPSIAVSGSDVDQVAGHPFLDGRVSLWFDSGRFVSTLAWARPDFPIGYVESPRRSERSPLVTWARAAGYVLRRDASDSLWPALRFLVSEDAAIVDAAAEVTQAPPAPHGPVGPPVRPQPGKPLWFPPFTGQLRADKFLASRYRTESKIVDEGRDHALEQLRHARSHERCPAADQIWPLLQEARLAALRGNLPARQALEDAQRRAQSILDATPRGTR